MSPMFERPRPRIALFGGVLATLVLAAVVGALNIEITRAVPALLLVLVVVFASIVGGRTPGFLVAGVATLAFTFALTPVGSPRVRFLDDFVALAIFAVVAFTVSTIVTSRVSMLEKIDEQRLALLRS